MSVDYQYDNYKRNENHERLVKRIEELVKENGEIKQAEITNIIKRENWAQEHYKESSIRPIVSQALHKFEFEDIEIQEGVDNNHSGRFKTNLLVWTGEDN